MTSTKTLFHTEVHPGRGLTRIKIISAAGELASIDVFHADAELETPARINWPGIGSVGPAKALAFAKALELAAEIADDSDQFPDSAKEA